MPGYQLHLESWLDEALTAGVLTSQEAWEVQDEMLLSQAEETSMPKRLNLVMERLYLFELEMPPVVH